MDGEAYKTVSGEVITKEQMRDFKQSGAIRDIAVEYCQHVLYEERNDPRLVKTILDCLSASLQLDPTRRPSSENLLDGVVNHLNLVPRLVSTFVPMETEDSLPPLDVSNFVLGVLKKD